jgi:hypothetical protein
VCREMVDKERRYYFVSSDTDINSCSTSSNSRSHPRRTLNFILIYQTNNHYYAKIMVIIAMQEE